MGAQDWDLDMFLSRPGRKLRAGSRQNEDDLGTLSLVEVCWLSWVRPSTWRCYQDDVDSRCSYLYNVWLR